MNDIASVISLFLKAYSRLRNRASSVTRLQAGLSRKLGSIPETDKKFFFGLQDVQTGAKTPYRPTPRVPKAFLAIKFVLLIKNTSSRIYCWCLWFIFTISKVNTFNMCPIIFK